MSDLITSLRFALVSLIACSIAYPAAVTGFAIITSPDSRQGSLVRDAHGKIVGSRLLAQKFTQPQYFWPRPSAVDYDASATGGSNLSPTNPVLTEQAREIIQRLGNHEGKPIPADLVSSSGSGMDPHITLPAALFQVPRVAAARGVTAAQVSELIRQHRDSTVLAAFGGVETVNVLELNLALEHIAK